MADTPKPPQTPTTLVDFGDWLNDDGWTSPPLKSRAHPDGRTYLVPSPDAVIGAKLTALGEVGRKVAHAQRTGKEAEISERDLRRLNLDDDEEAEFLEMVLGSAWEEMKTDGVSHKTVQRLAQYAFVYWTMGEEAAERAWNAGAFLGKDQPSNRQQRRSAAKAPRAPQASTGSRTTPSRARKASAHGGSSSPGGAS